MDCHELLYVWLMIYLIKEVAAPLPNYTPAIAGYSLGDTRLELITAYFQQGYSYNDILLCLAVSHGITTSLRSLKRILRGLRLKRRVLCTEDVVRRAVQQITSELEESGNCIGYKTMWRRLQGQGVVISRDTVRQIMLCLDEEGVRKRQRRRLRRRQYINPRPNFVWHVDGYDKLKPYGFPIHGAIDGFSRRILWLEVGTTNNNPKVVAKYYIETVLQLKTLPCIVRCDHGTENIHIRDIQVYLRSDGNDEFSGENSFMQGRSSSNQRIEGWWGILRKQCVQFWMNLFKDMVTLGMLNTSDPIHVHALRFCFIDLIENDIKRTAVEWNQHLIETKKNSEAPRGKPDMMYFNPEVYDTESYGCEFQETDANVINHELDLSGNLPERYDSDFLEIMNVIIPNWAIPETVNAALELYARILDTLDRFT